MKLRCLTILLSLISGIAVAEPTVDNLPGIRRTPLTVTLERTEYEEIRALSRKIRPSSTSVVIGIGQSSTPWVTYLSELSPRSSFNFPLSGFRSLTPGSLTEDELTQLHDHLDAVFPAKEKVRNKKLILTDFANRGASFTNQQHYLLEWLKLRGYTNEVEWVAVCTVENEGIVKRHLAMATQAVRLIAVDGILGGRLDRAEYDLYSEVGSADRKNEYQKHDYEGVRHGAFKNQLRQFINDDRRVFSDQTERYSLPTTMNCPFRFLGPL